MPSTLAQLLRPRLHRDRRGAATLEFVLVFPVVLFLVLTLLQVAFLMAGQAFVHYAAFAATRAAVSQVPAPGADEPRNVLAVGPGGEKFDRIRQAAVLAVLPAAGRSEAAGGVDAEGFVDAVRSYLADSGRGEPAWLGNLLADRLRYAAANTRIEVLRTEVDDGGDGVRFTPLRDGETHAFGPLDPITVRVEHDLYLSVPYVWRMFADGEADGGGGSRGGYARVVAQATLGIEGVDPAMPPPPALPREDP